MEEQYNIMQVYLNNLKKFNFFLLKLIFIRL